MATHKPSNHHSGGRCHNGSTATGTAAIRTGKGLLSRRSIMFWSVKNVYRCFGVMIVTALLMVLFLGVHVTNHATETKHSLIGPSAPRHENLLVSTTKIKASSTLGQEKQPHGDFTTVTKPGPGVYYGWGPEGVSLKNVLSYIDIITEHPDRHYDKSLIHQAAMLFQPFPGYIVVRDNLPTLWFPEKVMNVIVGGATGFLFRVIEHWQLALQQQLLQHKNKFSALTTALREIGSIPVLFDLYDYHDCADPLSNITYFQKMPPEGMKLPVFAFARSVNCNYGFPVPTLQTYQYAEMGIRKHKQPWIDQMTEWNKTYPWEQKIPKVYWRGTLKRPRKEFLEVVESPQYSAFLDASRGGRRHTIDPPEASMKYKAVFDIDGNSWSERFSRLLCYNSAIIKVNIPDDFEEYFMTDIIPGVHFIPASIENLTIVAQQVLEDSATSNAYLQQIVANANAWCCERLRVDRLNLDFLSVVNGYVEMLYRHDAQWSDKWQTVHAHYLGNGGFMDGMKQKEIPDISHPKPWREFLAITGHRLVEGPGTQFDVEVQWENGNVSWESLAILKVANPQKVSMYAHEKGLVDERGWKWARAFNANGTPVVTE